MVPYCNFSVHTAAIAEPRPRHSPRAAPPRPHTGPRAGCSAKMSRPRACPAMSHCPGCPATAGARGPRCRNARNRHAHCRHSPSRWVGLPFLPCGCCALMFLPFSELTHQQSTQLCEQRAPRARRACGRCALPFLPFSELNHQKFALLCEQRALHVKRPWTNFPAYRTVRFRAMAPSAAAH